MTFLWMLVVDTSLYSFPKVDKINSEVQFQLVTFGKLVLGNTAILTSMYDSTTF